MAEERARGRRAPERIPERHLERFSASAPPLAREAARSPAERQLELLDDHELAERIRALDLRASAEFFQRHWNSLMEKARQLGVPAGERWEVVTELIDEVVLRIVGRRIPDERDLGGYMVVALHRKVRNARRDENRRHDRHRDGAADVGAPSEAAVLSACSAYAIRTARAPDESDEPEHPAVRKLAEAIRSGLSEEDWDLAIWLSERVAQRDIAEWVKSTHGAVRARAVRLRRKMARLALAFEAQLEGEEREAVWRVLERYGVRGHPADDTAPAETRREEP